MNDTSKLRKKGLNIYSIHSTKGGVGKTSLALVIACIEKLKRDRKALILDGDLTGTSIDDIFGEVGKETKKIWLNDFLLANPTEHLSFIKRVKSSRTSKKLLSIEKFYKNKDEEFFSYIPSSSSYEKVKEIVPLVMQEDDLGFFTSRIEDLLYSLHSTDFDSVIIDTHPGFYGFSKAMFKMLLDIKLYKYHQEVHREKMDKNTLYKKDCEPPRLLELLYGSLKNQIDDINITSFFVVTSESADFLSAFPTLAEVMFECLEESAKEEDEKMDIFKEIVIDKRKPFHLLINKAVPMGDLEDPNPSEITHNMYSKLVKLNEKKRNKRLDIITEYFHNLFKKGGSRVGRFVNGFNIENIPNLILGALPKEIKETKEKYEPPEKWIQDIAVTTGLLEKQSDGTFV